MNPGKIQDWIILQNDDFIALNKPAGLLSIPDREGKEISLKLLLQQSIGPVFTVHRLDKDTSGVIVFARHEQSHREISMLFEERQTVKIYQGLVIGTPADQKGTINRPLAEHATRKGTMIVHQRGKEAITDYEVLQSFGAFSWLQFRIHTGRTHQIRVHAKDLGHPLVADPLYGDGKPLKLSSLKTRFKLSLKEEEERPLLGRLGLHACSLQWKDALQQTVSLEAPLPKDLRACLQQLAKTKKGS